MYWEMGILLLVARKWLIVSSRCYLHTYLVGLKVIWVMTIFLKPVFEVGTIQEKVTCIAIGETSLAQMFFIIMLSYEVLCWYLLSSLVMKSGSLQSSLDFLDMSITVLSELPMSGSTLQDLSAFKDKILSLAKGSGGKWVVVEWLTDWNFGHILYDL